MSQSVFQNPPTAASAIEKNRVDNTPQGITLAQFKECIKTYYKTREERILDRFENINHRKLTIRKQYREAIRVLKYLTQVEKVNENDIINSVFDGNFDLKKNKFKKKFKNKFANKTILNCFFYLELEHLIYIDQLIRLNDESLKTKSFAQLAYARIRIMDMSQEELAFRIKISEVTLNKKWLKGLPISKKQALNLKLLSEVLHIPFDLILSKVKFRGCLIKRIKNRLKKRIPQDLPLAALKYMLPFEKWPSRAKIEFNDYVKLKTQRRSQSGMLRGPIWTASQARNGEAKIFQVSTNLRAFQSFFGFLTAPQNAPNPKIRGLGMPIADMSIALVCVPELLEKMLTFLELRRKKYTTNAIRFLRKGLELLDRKGFVHQNPQKFKKFLPLLSKEKWHTACIRLTDEISDIKEGFGPPARGNDARKKLRMILELPHPLEAIMTMIFRYKHEKDPSWRRSEYFKATWARNLLIMEILAENPIRVSQFSLTYYDPNNPEKSNLVKRSDGVWGLRYNCSDFKNRKRLLIQGKEEYWAPLPPSLYSDIEEYLLKYWPTLVNHASSGPLFPIWDKFKSPNISSISAGRLSKMIQIISASYCTDEKGNPYVPRGFGAHAFRYIVVSEFLKNNPEHYHHAAELLNNTVGTTEKIYTYLTPADAFSKYIPQFDNMYEINKQKYLDRAKWSFLQTS